jgi:Ca2+-binding RTX toxin-like protein
VSCSYSPAEHALRVTIRDEREQFELPPGLPPEIRHEIKEHPPPVQIEPGAAAIERRGDLVTVLNGLQGAAVACEGPRPTVGNTASIAVVKGRHSETADLFVDLLHGALDPALSAEPGVGPELQLAADLGDGLFYLRGSREPESVAISAAQPGRARVEFGPDTDGTPDIAASAMGMIVDLVGGDDSLAVTGEPFAFEDEGEGVALIGGQGADTIRGGPGGEALVGGPGSDVLDAGGGRDFVMALDGARDRIDCGGGFDRALLLPRNGPPRGCERLLPSEYALLGDYSIKNFIEPYEDEVAVAVAGRLLRR